LIYRSLTFTILSIALIKGNAVPKFIPSHNLLQDGQETPSTLNLGIYSDKYIVGGDDKENDEERADNVSPPQWLHFMAVLWEEEFF
jgi:hypothetical protein